ncbi:unnamed protein product [Rotaria sordida]|uniref:Ankyrin repeat domain-containing protein n=1 Tax=Rotaria sordida TaxID=392033 RepID=A0A818KYR3_9BILA|nr:unnamed protein product [Rotaria sordida]CAF3568361.1 unnamed protein product [Rotaria sordida]
MSWRLAIQSTKLLFSYVIPYKIKLFREALLNANIVRIRQLAYEKPKLLQRAIDADGNTALGLAILLGEVDVVATLLELGSDPNIANIFDGNHPLVFLAKLRSEENSKTLTLVDLLLHAGSNPLCEIRCRADNIKRVDPTQTPSFYETPLLCSIRFQNESVLRKILQHGIDVNTLNPETGTSPLMLAAALGYLNICNFLLDFGADVNACDFAGNTPLHLAIQGFGDKLPILHTLLEYGANINAINQDGSTPAMFAEQIQDEECIRLLQSRLNDTKDPPRYQEVEGNHQEQIDQKYFSFT